MLIHFLGAKLSPSDVPITKTKCVPSQQKKEDFLLVAVASDNAKSAFHPFFPQNPPFFAQSKAPPFAPRPLSPSPCCVAGAAPAVAPWPGPGARCFRRSCRPPPGTTRRRCGGNAPDHFYKAIFVFRAIRGILERKMLSLQNLPSEGQTFLFFVLF